MIIGFSSSNYQFTNNKTYTFNYNDSNDIVPLTKKRDNDNVSFVIKGTNSKVEAININGGAGNDYIIHANQVPRYYHLANDGTQKFELENGKAYSISILPNQVADTIIFDGDNNTSITKHGIIVLIVPYRLLADIISLIAATVNSHLIMVSISLMSLIN